ncbi:MAG: hypothetical protein ABSF14_04280 [Terriglobia bacterium]|jgi:hypothetical protein
MQATVEYEPIVRKLLEKSEEGRLNWEKKRWGGFSCTIEEQYTFNAVKTADGYQLTMMDSQGDEMFSIAGEEAVVYDDPKKEELFTTLRDLYELARKKALNVDEKIATAAGLLDKV